MLCHSRLSSSESSTTATITSVSRHTFVLLRHTACSVLSCRASLLFSLGCSSRRRSTLLVDRPFLVLLLLLLGEDRVLPWSLLVVSTQLRNR